MLLIPLATVSITMLLADVAASGGGDRLGVGLPATLAGILMGAWALWFARAVVNATAALAAAAVAWCEAASHRCTARRGTSFVIVAASVPVATVARAPLQRRGPPFGLD
ncbi:MAG: hypothetical protein ACE5GB_03325 [Acidimicrobiales bacterium]